MHHGRDLEPGEVLEQGDEVVLVAVDAAVGEQPHQVQPAAGLAQLRDQLADRRVVGEGAPGEGLGDAGDRIFGTH